MSSPFKPGRDSAASPGDPFGALDDATPAAEFASWALDGKVGQLGETDPRPPDQKPGPARPDPDPMPPSGDSTLNTDLLPHVAPGGGHGTAGGK